MSSAYRVLFLSLFIDGSEVTWLWAGSLGVSLRGSWSDWERLASLPDHYGPWESHLSLQPRLISAQTRILFDVREHVSSYSHWVYSLIIKHPGYLINYSPLARGWRIWLMSQWHLLYSLYSVTSVTSGKIYPTCTLYSRVSGLLLITGNGPPSSKNVLQGNSTDALKEQIMNMIMLYCVHK